MPADFQLTCNPPIALLRVSGELDISSDDQLSDVFDDLTLRGCNHVDVDVGGVVFIDAYPLSRLRKEQVRLRAAGGDLVVVTASSWYAEVCELAQYDTLLPVHDTGPPVCAESRTTILDLVHGIVDRRGADGRR
jgi:anti-anti-sigma factor